MELLFEISSRLTAGVNITFTRYLYNVIDWSDRLIMIRGARGVGKTTLMLQRIKEAFPDGEQKAIYVTLDQLWFNDHTILELVDYHYKRGGTHIFLDEVHRYPRPNWEQELKNVYDCYPDYNVVFTGSSLLQLNGMIADLSRRVAIYEMEGLSFREYLLFEGLGEFKPMTLPELLATHTEVARTVSDKVKVIGKFEEYLKKGYYPFYLNCSDVSYAQRVERLVSTVIDIDIPAVENIEYETQIKLKKLLMLLSEQVPFTPNITKLCRDVEVTRNQLIKLLGLLCEGAILRQIFEPSRQLKAAAKPDKILFDNPSIMAPLGIDNQKGTVRETFLASMLAVDNKLFCATEGDFLVNRKYTFEVGGKKKRFNQIADKPDSFVAADDLETGFGNKIPLWLFGFLY